MVKLGRWLLGENNNWIKLNMKFNPMRKNVDGKLFGKWFQVLAFNSKGDPLGEVDFESVM